MEFRQKITTSAFIYNAQNQLFIAKRAATKKFLPNKYELPGGHTEFGESLEQSLIREIKEEFDMEIVVESPFYAFTYLSQNNTIHTVEVDYFARLKNENQVINLHPEDHSEYRWVLEADIGNYFDNHDAEGQAILKGFSIIKKSIIG